MEEKSKVIKLEIGNKIIKSKVEDINLFGTWQITSEFPSLP